MFAGLAVGCSGGGRGYGELFCSDVRLICHACLPVRLPCGPLCGPVTDGFAFWLFPYTLTFLLYFPGLLFNNIISWQYL